MAFVNATDSSATSLSTPQTIGPQTFTDLFSSPFNVGEGNTSTDKKTATNSLSQVASQDNPTLSGGAGNGPAALKPYDALLPDLSGYSPTQLAIGGGVALLAIIAIWYAFKKS